MHVEVRKRGGRTVAIHGGVVAVWVPKMAARHGGGANSSGSTTIAATVLLVGWQLGQS